MDGDRLSQGLGWLSVSTGLKELAFSERICRLLAVRRHAELVRGLGVREVLIGLGLLTQRDARPWLWGRVAGDVLKLSLLAVTLRRPSRARGWRLSVTAMVAGITLVDIFAASGRHAKWRSREGTLKSSRVPDTSHAPAESWRGSGLAEDIGVPPHPEEAEPNDAERERRMREAERQLGLPNPDAPGLHGA